MDVRRVLRRNSRLVDLYGAANCILNGSRLQREVSCRAPLKFFDYEHLAKPVAMNYVDVFPENNLYGLSYQLRRYLGADEKKRMKTLCYVEHGLYMGDYVNWFSYNYSEIRKVITFGDFREKVLNSHLEFSQRHIPILKIGPYIHYSFSLLKEQEKREIKETFGKILLVFPSHSVAKIGNVTYDIDAFCKEIDYVKSKISCDSVFVCLYWKDVEDDQCCKIYESHGFKIVCAGHRNDYLFMSRLKSIIELADYTMSNEVGTNLGYCIYMGKPHYVYQQKIGWDDGDDVFMKRQNMSSESFHSFDSVKAEIASFFSESPTTITEKQRKIVDYYWGLNNVKTPEELKKELIIQ